MDVEKFLNSLDNLFEKKKINEVPVFWRKITRRL